MPPSDPPDGLVVVLVRHAERLADGDDPALSPQGDARARLLARMLSRRSCGTTLLRLRYGATG